jgi:hypothetical protein
MVLSFVELRLRIADEVGIASSAKMHVIYCCLVALSDVAQIWFGRRKLFDMPIVFRY